MELTQAALMMAEASRQLRWLTHCGIMALSALGRLWHLTAGRACHDGHVVDHRHILQQPSACNLPQVPRPIDLPGHRCSPTEYFSDPLFGFRSACSASGFSNAAQERPHHMAHAGRAACRQPQCLQTSKVMTCTIGC